MTRLISASLESPIASEKYKGLLRRVALLFIRVFNRIVLLLTLKRACSKFYLYISFYAMPIASENIKGKM